MSDEPIGKGRRAIFGGPKPSEVKPENLNDKALILKDKAVGPVTIQPEETKLKDEALSPKVDVKEPNTHQLEETMPKADSIKPETLGLKDKGLNLKAETFNIEVLQQVISDSKSSRKTIAVWSPVISAALWYLKATTPMYSISDSARAWVEAGLERDHPELIKRIKAEMEKGKRS